MTFQMTFQFITWFTRNTLHGRTNSLQKAALFREEKYDPPVEREMDAAVYEVQYCREMQLSCTVMQKIRTMNIQRPLLAILRCVLCSFRGVQKGLHICPHQRQCSRCMIIYTAVQYVSVDYENSNVFSVCRPMLFSLSPAYLI